MDRRSFVEAFPMPETDHNHNTTSFGKKLSGRLLHKKSSDSSSLLDISDEVVKAATYMKFLLTVSFYLTLSRYFQILYEK